MVSPYIIFWDVFLFFSPVPFICTQGGELDHLPVKMVLLLPSFAALFFPSPCFLFLSPSFESFPHTTGLGKTQWGLFPMIQRGRQAKVPKCQMGCLTLVSSLGCDPGHSSPITVVPEGCTERDPTPMADVLPPGFILQCCLASWSKAPPWAKWLLELWFAKIQDVNLTVCYGYSALFQDVNLYLYSANQMLFRYCPS